VTARELDVISAVFCGIDATSESFRGNMNTRGSPAPSIFGTGIERIVGTPSHGRRVPYRAVRM
jgi:hypothetical protein